MQRQIPLELETDKVPFIKFQKFNYVSVHVYSISMAIFMGRKIIRFLKIYSCKKLRNYIWFIFIKKFFQSVSHKVI